MEFKNHLHTCPEERLRMLVEREKSFVNIDNYELACGQSRPSAKKKRDQIEKIFENEIESHYPDSEYQLIIRA